MMKHQSFFKKISAVVAMIFGLMPTMVLADEKKLFPDLIEKNGDDFMGYLNSIVFNIVSFIWIGFATFAVCMFIYAGFLFLNAKGDGKKAQEARHAVIWGSVGVAVALMAFTIPFMVSSLLGF